MIILSDKLKEINSQLSNIDHMIRKCNMCTERSRLNRIKRALQDQKVELLEKIEYNQST